MKYESIHKIDDALYVFINPRTTTFEMIETALIDHIGVGSDIDFTHNVYYRLIEAMLNGSEMVIMNVNDIVLVEHNPYSFDEFEYIPNMVIVYDMTKQANKDSIVNDGLAALVKILSEHYVEEPGSELDRDAWTPLLNDLFKEKNSIYNSSQLYCVSTVDDIARLETIANA